MPVSKISKKRKALCLIILVSFLIFSCPSPSSAALWPGIDPPIQRMLDTIFQMIQGIIMGTLKQQAATMLNSQMNRMIGGGRGGQAMFITNWQDYLVAQPMNMTMNYMNDYISQMTLGRGTSTGYSAEGFMGNYFASLQRGGAGTVNQLMASPKVTYEGSPSQMFDSGGFKNFNLYMSGANNPWGFNQLVTSEYQTKLQEQQRQAEIKAIAGQGFIGQEDKQGNTLYPGSLAKENIASTQDLGNKIIASAQNIPEVITSVVSQMITRAIQQGFTEVRMKVNSEMNQANLKMNRSIQGSGPGARF